MDETREREPVPPGTRRARRRATAWRAFDSGEFERAIETFTWLNEHDQLEPEELRALVEMHGDLGEPATASHAIVVALERDTTGQLRPGTWLPEAFDLLGDQRVSADKRSAGTLEVLQLAGARADDEAWTALAQPGRLAALDERFPDPISRLDALEPLTFAPAGTGIPEMAIARIEALGHLSIHDTRTSRAAERLLHDLGRVEAAYGIERARREARRQALADPEPTALPPAPLTGLTVVIAGGHAALRSLIARDLARDGASGVREIPSAQEAVRSGRDVDAMLAGADIAVLLVRQIAHSTSDQVRSAARKSGVPVVIAESAGTSGVRRALARFRERDPLDSPPSPS